MSKTSQSTKAKEPTGARPNAGFNTDVTLWQNLREGMLIVTDDGSVIKNGEGVIGRFDSRQQAEGTLRHGGWELGVAKEYWVKAL